MSACFTLRFKMLHRVLRCAFQLPGPSVIRLQPMCVAVGEQNPPCGTLETTKEYMFVERLIPPTRVPVPPRHDGPAPSGWAPPSDVPPSLPYMVRRSRMHNIPVYTDITHGNRRTTVLRRVEGDIWALDGAVKELLKRLTGTDRTTQVNEVTMSIRIKGHYDKEIKEWLMQKGF